MKTNELEIFSFNPNPRPEDPKGDPGKSKPEIPDDDEDDDDLFDENDQQETFDEDDEDLEEFDVAGEFSSSTMKEVCEYMDCSL